MADAEEASGLALRLAELVSVELIAPPSPDKPSQRQPDQARKTTNEKSGLARSDPGAPR